MPKGYWSSLYNQRKVLDDIGRKVEVKTLDDWHSKTRRAIIKAGGKALLDRYPAITC